MSLSRREFLGKAGGASAALAFMVANGIKLKANPLGLPIGSQTYPHLSRIQSGEFAGLLKDMKAIGIDVIELCSPGYTQFKSLADGKTTRKILDDNGIRCISAHFTMPEFRNQNGLTHAGAIQWAHDVGLEQMSTASILGDVKNGVTTMEAVKRACDEYNRIAAVTAKAGLAQLTHNEGFENSRLPDGRMTYFALLENFDPKLVFMQFQMSSSRGMDINPISMFHAFPGRFRSLHLQGVNMNPPPAYTPPAPPPDAAPAAAGGAGAAGGRAGGAAAGRGGRGGQLPVGSDDLEWGRIFEAAKIGGIKNYFVEQSWPLTQLSVAYLKNLTV